jgi:hypothetical protein
MVASVSVADTAAVTALKATASKVVGACARWVIASVTRV